MNLLAKFAAIEIRPDTRISDADRAFCQAHQAAYETAKDALRKMESFWDDTQREQQEALASTGDSSLFYLTSSEHLNCSEDTIKRQRHSLHLKFISRLVSYFNKTYQLDIQTDEISKNLLPHSPSGSSKEKRRQQGEEYATALENLSLRYMDILEQIFLQTNGRDLTEHAVCGLKEKCRLAAWRTSDGNARFLLKKEILQLEFACSCENYHRTQNIWNLFQTTKDIVKGIAHFETESFSDIPDSLNRLIQRSSLQDSFIEFTDCQKVQSMRLYKNRRTDIRFRTAEYAGKFVEGYLGTISPC